MYLVVIPIPKGRTIVEVREKKDSAVIYIRKVQSEEVQDGKQKPVGIIYRMGEYEEIH